MADAPSRKDVFAALGDIVDPKDPDARDIVETELVSALGFDGGSISVGLELVDRTAQERAALEKAIRDTLRAVRGVTEVEVVTKTDAGPSRPENARTTQMGTPRARRSPESEAGGVGVPEPIPGVDRIIAVASGKGGVGKSTTTVNLALALVRQGHKVGLLDCDVYGPSLPLLLGVDEPPSGTPDGKIAPVLARGMRLMSIGFFSSQNQPMIWRGPIVLSVVTQFLQDVAWGELDYLVVDLPPGTGDAPLTLVQRVPITGVIIVTTPSDVAMADAIKSLNMFKRVNVPVLGLVENMASFTCDGCGHVERIFGESRGARTSEELSVPFLGEIPLDPAVRAGGDSSRPVVAIDPDGESARPFMALADAVMHAVEGDGEPGGEAKKKGLFSTLED